MGVKSLLMTFRPPAVICMVRLVIFPPPCAIMFRLFLLVNPLLQEKKYNERAMLIYDGLHYDALAVSFCSNLILCLVFFHDKY
jgi:hypothetical protein